MIILALRCKVMGKVSNVDISKSKRDKEVCFIKNFLMFHVSFLSFRFNVSLRIFIKNELNI